MNYPKLILTTLLTIATLAAAGAEDKAPRSARDLASFSLISERNIFNPNRSPKKAKPAVRKSEAPRPRPELVALLGTMTSKKGHLAFFDGSRSEYRKVLKPADIIAGYKVSRIGQDHVTLVSDGEEIVLEVGMQMKRDGDEAWQVEGPSGGFDAPKSAKGSGGNSESASGEDESDILKRMMERAQESKK